MPEGGVYVTRPNVRRTDSLRSERSDLSSKRVAFNKSIDVRHIPRSPFVDNTGRPVAIIRVDEDDEDGVVFQAAREQPNYSPEALQEEARRLVEQVDQITCSTSGSPFPASDSSSTLERRKNQRNNVVAPERSPNRQPRNNRVELPRVGGVGDGKSNLYNFEKNNLVQDDYGGGYRGGGFEGIPEQDDQYYIDRSPVMGNKMSFRNNAVGQIVNRFNAEAKHRRYLRDISPERNPLVVPTIDTAHNSNRPFTYLGSNPSESLIKNHYVYRSNADDSRGLKSPSEVVYAQVVVNDKNGSVGNNKTTVHTVYPSHPYNGYVGQRSHSPLRNGDLKSNVYRSKENDLNIPSDIVLTKTVTRQSSNEKNIFPREEKTVMHNGYGSSSRSRSTSPEQPRIVSSNKSKFYSHQVDGQRNFHSPKLVKEADQWSSPERTRKELGKDVKDVTSLVQSRVYTQITRNNNNRINKVENSKKDNSSVSSGNKGKRKTKIIFKPKEEESESERLAKFTEYKGRDIPVKRGGQVSRGSSFKEDTNYYQNVRYGPAGRQKEGDNIVRISVKNDVNQEQEKQERIKRQRKQFLSAFLPHKNRKQKSTEGLKKSKEDLYSANATRSYLYGDSESGGRRRDGAVPQDGNVSAGSNSSSSNAPYNSYTLDRYELRNRKGPPSEDQKNRSKTLDRMVSPRSQKTRPKERTLYSDSSPERYLGSDRPDFGGGETGNIQRHDSRTRLARARVRKPAVQKWQQSSDSSPTRYDADGQGTSESSPEREIVYDNDGKSRTAAPTKTTAAGKKRLFGFGRRKEAAATMSEPTATTTNVGPPTTGRPVTRKSSMRYFGDTDGDGSSSERRRYEPSRGRVRRSASTAASVGGVKRGVMMRGQHNHRSAAVPSSSLTSSMNSSESENNSTSASNRSVFLHATTVADIPTAAMEDLRYRSSSREELSSNSGLQHVKTKKVSRSMSMLAPWKPRHYREEFEVDYMNNNNNNNNQTGVRDGRPPRPPRHQKKMINRGPTNTGQSQQPPVHVSEVSMEPAPQTKRKGLARSVSMPKDSRLAGWFRKKKAPPAR